MDAIKAWFNEYSAKIEAILATIYNFVLDIFNAEVKGEFENITK